MNGGVLSSHELLAEPKRKTGFSFAQISDSHIGFNKDPNHDVTKTLQESVDKINALEERPAFVIHTGDITHLAAEQFDTAAQVMKSARASQIYYVPGSMMCLLTMASSISNALDVEPWARAGKVLITTVCISLD